MKFFFLLNALAGSRKMHIFERKLERLLTDAGAVHANELSLPKELQPRWVYRVGDEASPACHHYVLLHTGSAAEAGQLCQKLDRYYGEDLVLAACGGDGSVNAVLGSLLNSKASLLVVPLGSGNDFVKTIYPARFKDGLKLLEALWTDPLHADDKKAPGLEPHLNFQQIDMISIRTAEGGQHYAVNALSCGWDSIVAGYATRISRKIPFLAAVSYPLGIIPALFSRFTHRMKLEYRGLPWPGILVEPSREEMAAVKEMTSVDLDYTLTALCNARYYGGGFMPGPTSDIRDGQLELAVSIPVGPLAVARFAGRFSKGEGQQVGVMRMFSVCSGKLTAADPDDPLCITYDGELIHTQSLEFKVLPQSLRLAIPKSFTFPTGNKTTT